MARGAQPIQTSYGAEPRDSGANGDSRILTPEFAEGRTFKRQPRLSKVDWTPRPVTDILEQV